MKVIQIPTSHVPLAHNAEDQRILAECDHLGMFQRPNLWSQFPFLPLKRGPLGHEEVGLLIGFKPWLRTVVLTNLWVAKQCVTTRDLARFPRMSYGSFEAIYNDGWRVD